MKRVQRLSIIAWALSAPYVVAALPCPKLNVVFPPGCKRGGEVTVTLAGADFEGVRELWFSRPGITAKHEKDFTFRISVDPQAPKGPVDVRAIGAWGISNPRVFLVGDLPESVEAEPNNLVGEAKPLPLNSAVFGRIDGRPDVDSYRFSAKKGEMVILDCWAERIDSRLEPVLSLHDSTGRPIPLETIAIGKDTRLDFLVPADGDYIVRVQEVIYNGSSEHFYRLEAHTRPVVDLAYPPVIQRGKPGAVTLLGRNLPGANGLDTVVGPGGPLLTLPTTLSAPTNLDPSGLAVDTLLRAYHAGGDAFAYRWEQGTGASQIQTYPIPVGLTDHPVILEKEPNQTAGTAQRVTAPTEIVGRLDATGGFDWYAFAGKKDQAIQIDVLAERQGSSLDVAFEMYRLVPPAKEKPNEPPTTQKLLDAPDDDQANIGRTKFDHATHDPPATTFTPPADGDYLLRVRNQSAKRIDPRMTYRIRLSPKTPDFRLVTLDSEEDNPNTPIARQGGTTYLHVFALRQDGFAGEIKIEALNLPAGVSAPATVIGPGVSEAPLVLKTEDNAPPFVGPIVVRGTATQQGTTIVRTSRAGVIVWPGGANQPKPSRLANGMVIAVREKAPYYLEATPLASRIAQGSVLVTSLKLRRIAAGFTGPVNAVTALHLPPNANSAPINIDANKNEALAQINFPPNTAPGAYSIAFRGSAEIEFARNPQDPKSPKAKAPVADPSLAFPVQIVARPFDLGLSPNNLTVKKGQAIAVKVTTNRQNNYKGPVQVKLSLPPGVVGLSAAETTVPADKNETTLMVTAAGDAMPGPRPFVTIRATATIDNQPVTYDQTLGVNVTP